MEGFRGSARLFAAAAAAALSAGFAGCGGGSPQDSKEPTGSFPVRVTDATFPSHQKLSQHSVMKLAVQNAGNKVVPNVAVTVEARGEGTNSGAFEEVGKVSDQNTSNLANPSRAVWILDNGPLGGTTAYSNTWALGPLGPGKTKVFKWDVTAVKAGHHAIVWRVAAGLNGKATAVLDGGGKPNGGFDVFVDRKPAKQGVDSNGRVVNLPGY